PLADREVGRAGQPAHLRRRGTARCDDAQRPAHAAAHRRLRAPPAHRGAVVGGAAQLREEGDHVSVAATNGNGTATPWFVRGRTALVTGATRGIGLECAVALARAGMRVLLVGRDEERLAQAERTVRERGGSAQVESLRADFASLASVRALAAE